MILMNGGVVAYYSGRQSTVALCTAMAETIALAKSVVKIKRMRVILFDLQCRQEQETLIHSTCVGVDSDNTAAIAVATGNDFTHWTVKHVTDKVRFIQECVPRQIILIAYIKTNKNIADIVTKLDPQFAQHRDYALGIIDDISADSALMAALAVIWRRIRFRI